jgi:hypothetical protein
MKPHVNFANPAPAGAATRPRTQGPFAGA